MSLVQALQSLDVARSELLESIVADDAALGSILAGDDAALALQLLMWDGSFKLVLEFELKTNQVVMSNV